MLFYSLLILGENKTISTPARDRNEALALFGKELNLISILTIATLLSLGICSTNGISRVLIG
jgi:hypothetical protein